MKFFKVIVSLVLNNVCIVCLVLTAANFITRLTLFSVRHEEMKIWPIVFWVDVLGYKVLLVFKFAAMYQSSKLFRGYLMHATGSIVKCVPNMLCDSRVDLHLNRN